MNDRLAFLRAIRAHPDEDTPRLAFADWLDEHDDPLGEFIRVQIELEPIRYHIDNPRAIELHRREDELLRAHGADWVGTDELLTNTADFGPVLRRGLPDSACLSLDTFVTNGEALLDAHPTLREVALFGLANRCDELVRCPLFADLDTLEIADWPTRHDAASLATAKYLDRIPRFKLWVGGEPWFLNELVRQADARWPHEIELVQVYGGAACPDPETARELDSEADRIAQEANDRLGRLAIRVTRPFERRFPINGDTGRNICAGRLPDGSPALASGSFRNWILLTFTEDGRVRDVMVRESPVALDMKRFGEQSSRLGSAFEEWVDEELQLELGTVWVREFAVEDLSVELWSSHLAERIADYNPNTDNPNDFEWENRGGEARGWLERRNFVINWGNDYWADWRGQIHSS